MYRLNSKCGSFLQPISREAFINIIDHINRYVCSKEDWMIFDLDPFLDSYVTAVTFDVKHQDFLLPGRYLVWWTDEEAWKYAQKHTNFHDNYLIDELDDDHAIPTSDHVIIIRLA